MDLNINLFIQISILVFFVFLFILSLIFTLKSKKEYRSFFILITLIALLCILDQVNFFWGTVYLPNIKNLIEAIIILAISVVFLFFAKNFVKLK